MFADSRVSGMEQDSVGKAYLSPGCLGPQLEDLKTEGQHRWPVHAGWCWEDSDCGGPWEHLSISACPFYVASPDWWLQSSCTSHMWVPKHMSWKSQVGGCITFSKLALEVTQCPILLVRRFSKSKEGELDPTLCGRGSKELVDMF